MEINKFEYMSSIKIDSININNIKSFYDEVIYAINNHQIVEIDCDDLREVDLSFVQIMLSARREASKVGVIFRLKQAASGFLWGLLERGGFIYNSGEPLADQEFWMAQEAR